MILERIKKGIIIGDGGTIFELEHRGYVSAGPFTPEAVIEHPEAVKQLQTEFSTCRCRRSSGMCLLCP